MPVLIINSDALTADVTIDNGDGSTYTLTGAEMQVNTQSTGSGVFNAFAASKTISLQGGPGIQRTLTINLNAPVGQATVALIVYKNNGKDGSNTLSITAKNITGGFFSSPPGYSTGAAGEIVHLPIV